jgi:hypothetical protein
MTISNQTILRNDYIANGTNTIFAFNFPIFYEPSEAIKFSIQVIITNEIGIETIKTESIDYTITYNALNIDNNVINQGNVVFTTAPANLYRVSLLRKLNLTQNTNLTNKGTDKFSGANVEASLDKLTLINLENKEIFNRCVLLPKSTNLSSIELPIKLENANKVITVNSAGDNLEVRTFLDQNLLPVSSFMETILVKETANEARQGLGVDPVSSFMKTILVKETANEARQGLGVDPATHTIQGISYINNRVKVVNDGTNPNDTIGFIAGTFITSSGIQIYLPTTRKKIQSSGVWTAGDTNNGLDTGARVANTFYRTFVIQNNTSGAYDILFSISATSPTVPSGYTNLGIMDYALIRANSSNIIPFSRWDANDKKLVLGASQQIVFVSSLAGSGNALIVNTTEPLEFDVKLTIGLTTTGFSDFAVYGNEQDGSNANDCLVVGTNNGFSAINNGLAYTNDGRIYWKNFNTVGGVVNQTGIIKAIKIRS